MREPVPPELQEVFRLDVVQPVVPGIDKGTSHAMAIDPCYISKSEKKTSGIDWFSSGCAAAMKEGLEILGISIVDADAKDSVFLKAEQTFTDKKRGRKPDFTKGMKDPYSLTGWYLRMLNQNPVAQRCNGGSI